MTRRIDSMRARVRRAAEAMDGEFRSSDVAEAVGANILEFNSARIALSHWVGRKVVRRVRTEGVNRGVYVYDEPNTEEGRDG